jgi:hypothetical protein
MRRKKSRARNIAISLLILAFLALFGADAFADAKAGTVTHLSGPLFATKADGTTRVLSVNSIVEQGDTLVTEKGTYARVKFVDGGEITLRPQSQIKLSAYQFDQASPGIDRAILNLIKGGIRSITGLIGKRGNRDNYKFVTPTAVTGVRGTTFECRICEGNCGSIPDGLYFFVAEGAIAVSNAGGLQTFSAGQYAYVQSGTTKPVILPANPGIDFKTMPPAFGVAPKDAGGPQDSGCIVR